jgi:hypothetical protein
MSPPDFDFQLGKSIRLRGWGLRGFAALVLLLFACVIVTWLVGPTELIAGTHAAITHLISARENPSGINGS